MLFAALTPEFISGSQGGLLSCEKVLLRTCLFKGGCKCITLSKKMNNGQGKFYPGGGVGAPNQLSTSDKAPNTLAYNSSGLNGLVR